ncbi:hypothetical protein OIU85_009648 [Salix viminalis]|uniref:Uncharacterized protein n=1 Tax=Salix viminalis TaxID=40686 RepID=A0A9Q0SGP3_SALVM|nr:hypothetical protein OIU85_009648 [Salix viminalis]
MNFALPSSSPIRLAPSFWLQPCTIFGRREIEESSTTVQDPSKRSVLSCSSRFETRSPIWALILQSQKPRGVCGTWTTCSLFLLCFGLWAASKGNRSMGRSSPLSFGPSYAGGLSLLGGFRLSGVLSAGQGFALLGFGIVLRRGAPPSQLGVGLQPLGIALWMACEVGLL